MKDPVVTKTAQDIKAELEKSAKHLRELSEEVRVQIHLGSLDVRDEWRRLEPRLRTTLEQAEKDITSASRTALTEVTDASRSALAEVTDAVRRLRQTLVK
jgi:hypothetical protein